MQLISRGVEEKKKKGEFDWDFSLQKKKKNTPPQNMKKEKKKKKKKKNSTNSFTVCL